MMDLPFTEMVMTGRASVCKGAIGKLYFIFVTFDKDAHWVNGDAGGLEFRAMVQSSVALKAIRLDELTQR